MDYKIWFNQILTEAINRTRKIGFRQSLNPLDNSGVLSDFATSETVERLWSFNSPTGPFDDPALHQELDRLMARMRIS